MNGSIRTFTSLLFASALLTGTLGSTSAMATEDDDRHDTSLYTGLRLRRAGTGADYVFTDWNRGQGTRSRRIPRACANFEKEYMDGFTDAISGHRFLTPLPFNIHNWREPAETDPSAPSRQACSDLADEKLTCCRLGYRRGLPKLSEHIDRIKRSQGRRPNPSDTACVEDYDKGFRSGTQICRSVTGDTDACPARPGERMRFLACFHIGMNRALASCNQSGTASFAGSQWLRFAGISARSGPPRASETIGEPRPPTERRRGRSVAGDTAPGAHR